MRKKPPRSPRRHAAPYLDHFRDPTKTVPQRVANGLAHNAGTIANTLRDWVNIQGYPILVRDRGCTPCLPDPLRRRALAEALDVDNARHVLREALAAER